MKTKIDYTKFALSKDDILWEIRQRCIKEMYAKAQPSIDYDEVYVYYKLCKEEGKEPEQIFKRYYLSQEEFKYIEEKYLELFNLINPFQSHCDILIRDLRDGCHKDKYIKERVDEEGFKYPGYMGFEDVPNLEAQMTKYLQRYPEYSDKTVAKIAHKLALKVLKFIEERKNYYKFNSEENKFRFNVALTDSPTSNAEEVIEYWKSKGKDIEIDPRHYDHNYFWAEEHGYLEENE